MSKYNIDYLTVSLGRFKSESVTTTGEVLNTFAAILPELYKATCREMRCGDGLTMRVSQYGISVSQQYGTALAHGWLYSVQLSGDYWQAIERNRGAVEGVLSGFTVWRVSRLDLACDVCVPLEEWREYCKVAFTAGYSLNGMLDARTVYYGSRKSQFYTRIYNKTAEDGKHYPAPEGFVQIRFEVEVHRVKGELILAHAFDSDFTDRLFLFRAQYSAKNDSTGFIGRYFAAADAGEKIKTVKRVLGNLESTTDYIFNAYAPYISATLHSQLVASRYKDIEVLDKKGKKVLAILDSELLTAEGKGGADDGHCGEQKTAPFDAERSGQAD